MTAFLVLWASALPAAAQEEWEGKKIERAVVAGTGWHLIRLRQLSSKLNAKRGEVYTPAKRDDDYRILFETKYFEDVQIHVAPGVAGGIVVTIDVVEALIVKDVLFTGLNAIPLNVLRPKLRLNPGDRFSRWLLKVDLNTIREEYLVKGYHFVSVNEKEDEWIVPTRGGVIIHWQISEGPLVTVREIQFTGNAGIPAKQLKEFLITRENSYLFGVIPSGTHPYVRRYVDEDVKRIKLYYQLEGWLDIVSGERVFLEDEVFSEDKTEVTIRIHVDEGQRYRIRSLQIRQLGGVTAGFKPEETASWLASKVGEFYSDNSASKDVGRIREKYGEKAYILAEITSNIVVDFVKYELDLVFEINERDRIRVGRITVNGNYKTRTDVILRELKDFIPGQEFNNRLLSRGVLRLRDRGYFDPQGGLAVRFEEGATADERDVVLDVKEGQTGNIRFAGGYSSSYGILGILELTQKNFDLTDLPKSFGEIFQGTAFAGGGQIFSVRLQPSARRQSLSINFKEPYLFGYEYGLSLRGYDLRYEREDWDEEKRGAAITLDKRVDLFRFELGFNAFRIQIDDIDTGAPATVLSLDGTNRIVSLTPRVTFDSRDSFLFPSEGMQVTLGYEYAGQVLGGDFDFWKATFDTDLYFTVLETEDKLKHVLQFHFTFGLAEETRDTTDVPFFERFYAGGRDSIRGFEFRGMGPHENGDPVGGDAYAFASVEYSFPLLVEFLRGAAFYDIADLTDEFDDMKHDKWRQTIGFGIRFIIPQLGNIPVALDFGFPLTKQDEDERQTVTFDIGKLF